MSRMVERRQTVIYSFYLFITYLNDYYNKETINYNNETAENVARTSYRYLLMPYASVTSAVTSNSPIYIKSRR